MAISDRSIPGVMPASPGFRPCCMLQPNPIRDIDSVYDLTATLDHVYGTGKWGYTTKKEVSGLLYSCSLGFIDLGHTRETTDFTWFFFAWIRRMQKNKIGGTFPTNIDFGGTVAIKKDIPRADHVRVARSIAYDQALFHEIWSFWVPVVGAHTSSFSPEDLVSNFVGTYIAEQAINGLEAGLYGGDFNKAATTELIQLLMRVQVLPENKVLEAFDQINGRWIVGNAFDNSNVRYLRRRNFDVSPIVPWLVLDEPACDPLTLPPDFEKEFAPDTKTFYEIEFNLPPPIPLPGGGSVDIQSLMGGAKLNTSNFDHEITRIKTEASRPEADGGYGSDFDKP